MTGVTDQATRLTTAAELTPTEREIIRISEDVTNLTGIGPDDDLFDLGVTSLAFIRIMVTIRDRFGVPFTGAELGDDASIANLAAQVDATAGTADAHERG